MATPLRHSPLTKQSRRVLGAALHPVPSNLGIERMLTSRHRAAPSDMLNRFAYRFRKHERIFRTIMLSGVIRLRSWPGEANSAALS